MTAITGNTFPVRVELRDMGGQWNAGLKAWMVPDEKADLARALVGDAREYAHTRRRSTNSQTYRAYGSRYTRFSGGGEHYVNRRGRCEDAPCCGCCS